ncbi:MAG TPA: hypothetical protein VF316_11410 [Polyangiaceae bacterium]
MKSSGKEESKGAVGVRDVRSARRSAASRRRRVDAAAPSQGTAEAAAEPKRWEATNEPKVTGAMLDAAGGGDELDDDDFSAELELASQGAKSSQVQSAVEGLIRHRATFNASIFPDGGFGSEEVAYDALGPAVEKERRVAGALRLYAKGEVDADRVLEEIARCRSRYTAQLAKR